MNSIRVILSSSFFLGRLMQAMDVERDKYTITVRNERMIVEDTMPLSIACSIDFTVEIAWAKMNRLIKILRLLSDQPITLDFGDVDFGIIIKEAVI